MTLARSARPHAAERRAWSAHALLMGGGIVAGAQIGKAVITVPMIRADLTLGRDLAGLIVAIFATMGAIAIGTVVGAGTSGELALFATRIISRTPPREPDGNGKKS